MAAQQALVVEPTVDEVPLRDEVLHGCRQYAASERIADPACMLEGLRCVERCLLRRALARLDAAARSHVHPDATPVPLGAFVRRFAAWLVEHPERAGEPVAWLVEEVLAGPET